MIAHALRRLLVAGCALAALSAPAYAEADAWGDIEVIDDADMEDLRGGFNIGGMEIGFGAVVTSTLNGVPVMTTNLTITDTGAVVQQTMHTIGENLGSLTPAQLEALGLAGLEGLSGVVINTDTGLTAFVHNATNGTLQNITVNTASGQEITQTIDVMLTLPGFDHIQSEFMAERFGMQISDDLQSIAFGWQD